MSVVIESENLSKRFRLGLAPSFDRVTEILQHSLTGAFRAIRSPGKKPPTEDGFWALQDVSFTIRDGEVVGIIGRNGAGKSTLLKILSRITRPTRGCIRTRGRIASLLEVGAGFHPELTGRENIFLNGSILGMSRREIEAKFDRIVDFAEVEKFLDTPVKRYSSGMYTRLAFSVAAFLEPEILIVDEVLAVGDAEFQQKCLAKMDSVARSGRTVLFVSHNLKAVRSLCPRGLLLRHGQLISDAPVDECLAEYRRWAVEQDLKVSAELSVDHPGYQQAAIELINHQAGTLSFRSPIEFQLHLCPLSDSRELKILFRLRDLYGNLILHGDNGRMNSNGLESMNSDESHREDAFVKHHARLRSGQRESISVRLEAVPLLPGRYSLEVALSDAENSSLNGNLELTFDAEGSADTQMADTLASDLSSLYWPARFCH